MGSHGNDGIPAGTVWELWDPSWSCILLFLRKVKKKQLKLGSHIYATYVGCYCFLNAYENYIVPIAFKRQ